MYEVFDSGGLERSPASRKSQDGRERRRRDDWAIGSRRAPSGFRKPAVVGVLSWFVIMHDSLVVTLNCPDWRSCVPMPDDGVRCADVIRREVGCSRKTRPPNGKHTWHHVPEPEGAVCWRFFSPGPRTNIVVFIGERFWIVLSLKEWRPEAAKIWFEYERCSSLFDLLELTFFYSTVHVSLLLLRRFSVVFHLLINFQMFLLKTLRTNNNRNETVVKIHEEYWGVKWM